jgi:hypothetical protein
METMVIYQGRVVPEAGFRAWIYSADNESKCVNSWKEYLYEISTGTWFSTKEEIPQKVIKAKEKGSK